MDGPKLIATLRLCRARNVGPVTFRKLVRVFGSAQAALNAPRDRLLEVPDVSAKTVEGIRAAADDPWAEDELQRAKERGIRILTLDDEDYPRPLLSTYDPPPALYVEGSLLPEDALSVAIVGSRHCSLYGREMAAQLAAGLARAGFTVVSGLARGIDSSAHAGALDTERGRTIAVLGNGLGTVYPPENKALYDRLVGQGGRFGCALSELPLETAPAAQHFPGRNRIIAGMTLGTIVVEGTETSGSLITARYALDMNREVFAVPGSVHSPNSRGPHRLIKKGAKLVEDIEDVLEELRDIAEPMVRLRRPDARFRTIDKGEPPAPVAAEKAEPDSRPSGADLRAVNLNPREQQVYDLLDANTARSVDDLIVASGLQAHEVLATLLVLEVRRLCRQLPGKRFLRA
jgi:DNA processing protein